MELSVKKTLEHYWGSQTVYVHRNTNTLEQPILEGGRYYISSDLVPMFHATDENGAIHAFDAPETFEHWQKCIKGKPQPPED